MVVINTLKSEEESLASFEHLLKTVQFIIGTFTSISFHHMPRLSNNVAHNLAKHAIHVRGLVVWIEDVPSHLHDVLIADYG